MSALGVGDVSLDDLRGVVGDQHAREAIPEDAIDGVQPSWVVAPDTVDAASQIMRLAHTAGLAIAPRGAGTKMGWGNPPERFDLIVETGRMNRVVEHAAGDLVVLAQAGTALQNLQDALSGASQMLGLDSLYPGATLGGIIATNAAGPHRLRYGTMRDLLIGTTVILPDGTVAKSGGRVVKNVAGYDLGKLFTGSLGTLGLIVEVIFRLHASPSARQMVVIELETPDALGEALQALLHSSLVPTALDLQWEGGHGRLIALFEGVEPSVIAQSERAAEVTALYGQPRLLGRLTNDGEALWETMLRPPWRTPSEVGVKIGTVPDRLPRLLKDVSALCDASDVRACMSGQAAPTVPLLCLGGDEASIVEIVNRLRTRVVRDGGNLVVVHASPSVKAAIDVWGPMGDALVMMRRVKERFDPQRMMNPGRFVGGI